MKALLVTSRVTFVPNNYDDLIAGLADCPQVGGLLILDNASRALFTQGLGLFALGARGIAWHLTRNQLGLSHKRRHSAYHKLSKPVWVMDHVNCDEALNLVRDHGFDLIVNARTRCIYKKAILQTPRLGCINIHHGLLPHQRGTMCDLWSLSEKTPTGFSVHRMSEKIDAGHIIKAVQVSDGNERSYLEYLKKGVQRELVEIRAILAAIESNESSIVGQPNTSVPGLKHRRNPTWREIRQIRQSGLSV